MTPNPPRIFISYARKDGRDLALKLKARLEADGDSVWLDTAEIDGGASWSREIEQAIDACPILIALCSTGAYESEICRAEQLRALRKRKRVVPVLVHPKAERPIHLEALNYRDFSEAAHFDGEYAKLRDDMADGAYSPPPVRETINTAPPEPPHFVPRPDELQRVRAALINDSTDRQVALTALQGMGGIGKSVLAAAVCRDSTVSDAFPDGVLWVEIITISLTRRMRQNMENGGYDPQYNWLTNDLQVRA